MSVKSFTRSAVLIAAAFAISPAFAGFLEMPDTTEVPEMERDSMLKDLDIPNVRERDPDPNAGPRLNVTEFRVQGVVEYPELGITRESLNKLVESIRFDMMSEGEMLESGYTLDEVSEISDLMAEIEDDTEGDHVGPLEVQRLVFLIREQRQRRGVTVGMIENVADTITRYYRERGFILAKAYIPEQRVRDGVVTLTLLLGNLGEVQVENNKRYKDRSIQKIFKDDYSKPITAENIEELLFFVNDLPGLTAQAYFEPGSQVGDTRLNVNVLEERMFNANVRLDNHGSESNGKYRLYTDGYWNNPTGFGDQLHIGILGTFEPANSIYGSIHYGIPIFGPRAKFTFGGSTNDFVTQSLIQGQDVELTGASSVLDATLNYILKRSRVQNYSVETRLAHIDTDIDSDNAAISDSADENDETINNLDLVFNFDVLHEKWRALHQGGVRLTYGDITQGLRSNQNKNPLIFAMNYSMLKFVKVPFTDAQSRLMMQGSMQYAEGALPSTSQFTLTGPNRMRAFPINGFNADRGFHGSVDWIFNAPSFLDVDVGGDKLSTLLQPYVFMDIGYGDSLDQGYLIGSDSTIDLDTREWQHAADIGVGLKFAYKNRWRFGFTFAQAIVFEKDTNLGGSQGPIELSDLDETSQLYFDFMYSY